MRLLLVDPNMHARTGHPIPHAVAIAQRMIKCGHETVVGAPRETVKLVQDIDPSVPAAVVPSVMGTSRNPVKSALMAVRAARQGRFDVLWCATADSIAASYIVASCFPSLRSPWPRGPLLMFTFHRHALHIGRAASTRNALLGHSLRSRRAAAIFYSDPHPSGVLLSSQAWLMPHPTVQAASSSMRMRQRHGIPPRRPVVGFVGTLRREKGISVALAAFAKLKPADVTFVVAGAIANDATRTVAELDRARERLGSTLIVDIRELPYADYLAYLATCDIVVLPYDLDSYSDLGPSGVLSEAIRLRRRVVCTLGAKRSVAEVEYPNTWYCEPHSESVAQALSDAIADLVQADVGSKDPGLRSENDDDRRWMDLGRFISEWVGDVVG